MVDLHSHTDRSDGTLSPEELVDLAGKVGLKALAVTDHDTVAGFDAAVGRAREVGLELICGVELCAKFRGKTVHVLGYFFEGPADRAFRRRLAQLQETRRDRNRRLAERLRGLGMNVTLEEAEALGRDQTGRPHFAALLASKGYVADRREAFEKYLDDDQIGFVPREEPSLDEVFGWIRASNGLTSWAHPGRFVKSQSSRPEELFEEMAAAGAMAIEAYHRDHDASTAGLLRRAAENVGLAVSGGSDFHGPTPGGVPLGGLGLPDSLLADLRAYGRKATARA